MDGCDVQEENGKQLFVTAHDTPERASQQSSYTCNRLLPQCMMAEVDIPHWNVSLTGYRVCTVYSRSRTVTSCSTALVIPVRSLYVVLLSINV